MKGFAYYLGKKVISNKFLYLFLNLTWGLLMTVLGFILLLVLLPFGTVKKYNGILYLQLKYNQNSHRIGYRITSYNVCYTKLLRVKSINIMVFKTSK